MKFHAQIGDKTLTFSTLHARIKFFEHKGKHVIITIDDKPTANARRFFEGAVVPYIFYQSATSWENFKEARESIKAEFLPSYTRSIRGEKIRVSRSTTELSKAQFNKFLEEVLRWMESNGYEAPDSEDYKNWENSAPDADEIYPPLKRLIARSAKHKN